MRCFCLVLQNTVQFQYFQLFGTEELKEGAKREMNTVKFWLEPALDRMDMCNFGLRLRWIIYNSVVFGYGWMDLDEFNIHKIYKLKIYELC